MKRFLKIFFYTILIALLLFQFYPKPEKNTAPMNTNDITLAHHVPAEVLQVLQTSCYDCHSNKTGYPWYSNLQPVAMWLGNHIDEGKAELNFSEFGSYSIGRKYKKLEEINQEVKEGEMPLSSYTIIHRNARLNERQKLLLTSWVTALSDSIKANYPADSLSRKKR